MKNDPRPTNVNPANLMAFAWPVAALVSITHRIAGVILFVGIAFALYALDTSLASEVGFTMLKGMMRSPIGMFVTWGLLASLAWHFVAGIKHLLMDMGYAETLAGSKLAAQGTLLCAGILIFLAGVWVLGI